MDERDRSRSPSRRTSRVEQVVGRWLRRSRDSTSRERVIEDGRAADASPHEQRSCSIRLTAQIPFDSALNTHGFTVSTHTPPQVQEVTAGGPADGKLLPGDQLVKINNVAVDDLSAEQAADIIRECQDTVTMTVLRITVGPKSSFITPEKRAKLKSNPVKVHFAEEVVVNGHSQGNSLLFLPNVLKVYLENGQTKAFKFEPKTTVKDIVMTLKEKLSLSRIEHFSLVLEQQYSIAKLFLLHEEELIQEVVQKKESHDYRCLFRVCFIPKEPSDMLEEDPVAFEYLYLQSVGDVLQERFAVEMKCNTALRLAALHVQERLASTGQPLKTPLKTVTKDWGIESFVSSTLLRNMREKDLRKAISYHMKKILVQEPKQKVVTVNQARLNYLNEMSELKTYGGKSFSATMMLQDRESMVSLLVGAQYGVSQVINHKLSIMTTLTEFSSITRVELTPESDRVSLVKIYLQDIKPLTLLLESVAAKDLSCLIAGYCKLMVDPQICVFPWTTKTKGHRISAEEGYVSRCGSESEDSDTDLDALIAHVSKATKSDQQEAAEASNYRASSGVEQETETTETKKEDQNEKQVQLANGFDTKIVRLEKQTNSCVNVGKSIKIIEVKETVEKEDTNGEKETKSPCVIIVDDPPSEASDSCQTDSRFLTSMSSDSMDALEEDDLLTYCSTGCPSHLDVEGHYLHVDPSLLSPSPKQIYCQDTDFHNELGSDFDGDSDPFVCFAALSSIAECLPSPPEASEDEDCEDQGAEVDGQRPETSEDDCERAETTGENVFTFEQGDTRCYYNICSNVTPDSAHSLPRPPTPPVTQKEQRENGQDEERETEPAPILQPPPGFGDSSSDDEFFDAQERFTSPEEPSSAAMAQEISTESTSMKRTLSLSDIGICFGEQETTERDRMGEKAEDLQVEMENDLTRFRKRSRKRRSFMETDYTSLVSFPEEDQTNNCNQIPNHQSGLNNRGEGLFSCFDGGFSDQSPCPTVSSLTGAEGEPAQLESKPITPSKQSNSGTRSLIESNKMSKASQRKQQLMLMEPDSMEFKSVTELVSNVPPAITASRTCVDLKGKENNIDSTDGEEESAVEGSVEGFLADHLFFAKSRRNEGDKTFNVKMNNQDSFIGLSQGTLDKLKTCSLSRLGQTPLASSLFLQVPTISCSQSLGVHSDEKSLEMGIQKGPVEPVERSRSQSMSAAFGRRTPLSSQRHLFAQRESLFQSKDPDHDDLDTSSDPSIQELSSSVPSMELNQGYLLTPCSTGILGRLSASTLRGKIQNLPLYLSRSQEVLDGNTSICGNTKPARRFSETRTKRKEVEVVNEESEEMTSAEKASEVTEVKVVTIVSEEVTEVIEEVREVNHKNSQGHGQQKTKTEPQGPPQAFNSPSCPQSVATVKVSPSSVVVTTQNLNGPWGVVASPEIGGLQGGSSPLVDTHSHHLASGCGVFTNCESKPTSTQPKALPSPCPHGKPDLSCSSALAMGCERVMDGAQTPLEVCGCQAVYTNCFSGVLDSGSFDDELTVYEFSCRTQPEASDQAAQMTTAPPSSLSDSPASFSPSSPLPPFPRVVLPPSSSELGPLLSPLHAHDCFLSDPHEDTIAALLSQHYPLPPTGFLALQRDVDTLLTVLAGAMKDQDGVQEHLRDNCAAHFSENKQKLHAEARGLLTGCQQVVRVGQTPAETLEALVESFHSLVQLTSVCLSFSSCQRCRERHTQALSGLADLAQTYQEFALAAERVGITTGKRTCHDLSIKLLARQCTALTTSVFCLTQLFRTLTAL